MSESLSIDDLTAIEETHHATWSSGDYAVIGTTLQLMGELPAGGQIDGLGQPHRVGLLGFEPGTP